MDPPSTISLKAHLLLQVVPNYAAFPPEVLDEVKNNFALAQI